jgi:hypothetical protein
MQRDKMVEARQQQLPTTTTANNNRQQQPPTTTANKPTIYFSKEPELCKAQSYLLPHLKSAVSWLCARKKDAVKKLAGLLHFALLTAWQRTYLLG